MKCTEQQNTIMNNIELMMNPFFNTDGYKLNHLVQMPKGTNFVYSNFTPRSANYFTSTKYLKDKHLYFVGIQGFVKKFLIYDFNKYFFDVEKEQATKFFFNVIKNYVGVLPNLFEMIERLHDMRYLPILLKALPEGSRVIPGTPVFTIYNTDPDFFWLPGYLEDALSNQNWKSCTIASLAYNYRYLCELFAKDTCDDNSHVKFQCHDFSQRGLSGMDDSRYNSIGHLTSFIGSDNIPSIAYANACYKSNQEDYLYAATVPATEHSVMCMGTKDDEFNTYKRLITELYPSGFVSIVSDTWDLWNVLTWILPQLKDDIMKRDGRVVIRPDSGNPVKILCGYKVLTFEKAKQVLIDGYTKNEIGGRPEFLADNIDHIQKTKDIYAFRKSDIEFFHDSGYDYLIEYEDYNGFAELNCIDLSNAETIIKSQNELKGAIQILWEVFGGTINSKGFKVLDPHIGVLYGDSITIQRAEEIFEELKENGFASSNVVLGVGSYTYQYITRDTFGFAMKATYGEINDQPINLLKDPVTDSGIKKSRSGLLLVQKDPNTKEFSCKDLCTKEEESQGWLKPVYKNGVCLTNTNLDDIRITIDEYIKLDLSK